MSKLQPNFIAKAKQQMQPKQRALPRTLLLKEAKRVYSNVRPKKIKSTADEPCIDWEYYVEAASVPNHRRFSLLK